MKQINQHYIDGAWRSSKGQATFAIENPSTEKIIGTLTLGSIADVDDAVSAAQRAFQSYSRLGVEARISLLEALVKSLESRRETMIQAIMQEIGSPQWLSSSMQFDMALGHIHVAIGTLKTFRFEEQRGRHIVRLEPIGVCGLITPWNFPVMAIVCKLAPALATGCTVVLKPSEYSSLSAEIFASAIHDAGYAPGVFNMVFGSGEGVGEAISGHPAISMVSITGSTRAGIAVAKGAAETVKRVHQELGGKSPNIILPSAPLEDAVSRGVKFLMLNSGQGCSLPSRMIAPNACMDKVKEIARKAAEDCAVGAPESNVYLGPVANKTQFRRVQDLIASGISEGATVVTGGVGRPEGLAQGYFVRPTVFADTHPHMRIVREEIFGPVLVIQGYDGEEEALALAADTDYGLAAYVEAGTIEEARVIANQIPAGQVAINGPDLDITAPFGGYKRSGNGREWGAFGFESFLETKAVITP